MVKENTWGGARAGAGRKPTGAKLRTFKLTDAQYTKVRAYVKKLKYGNKKSLSI